MLADTLSIIEETYDFQIAPRRVGLAPYPPAAGGENRIRFGDQTYYAWGFPVRVARTANGEPQLIRHGTAGAVPVFVAVVDSHRGIPAFIYAPITDRCILLPFRHEAEMMN
jgi:hypothetical protein